MKVDVMKASGCACRVTARFTTRDPECPVKQHRDFARACIEAKLPRPDVLRRGVDEDGLDGGSDGE